MSFPMTKYAVVYS